MNRVREHVAVTRHYPRAGRNGIAMQPPSYGIEFVDRHYAGSETERRGGRGVRLPQLSPAMLTTRARDRQSCGEAAGHAAPCASPRKLPTAATTSLPAQLQANLEALSGLPLDDVQVHYHSSKPAELQAVAYPQGTDIYVRPGQEQHLSHEAWHVVQQKQGRVQPTLQLQEGVPVNDDKGLEQEADVMGRQATQRKLPKSPVTRPDTQVEQRGKSKGEHGSVAIIQRKVGFEFETGWYVQREPRGKISQQPLGEWLKKKDPIGRRDRDGYKMEADEAEGGKSEVEFIVHPPIEENDEGIERLDNIMSRIELLGQAMKAQYPEPFSLGSLTGDLTDSQYIIIPRADDNKLKAGPQVTTGLKLEQIESLGSLDRSLADLQKRQWLWGNQDVSDAPEELKRAMAVLQNHAAEVRKNVQGDLSSSLIGLLAIIRSYLRAGSLALTFPGLNRKEITKEMRFLGALNYPKRIADLLLARTHFGKLFSLLPPSEQGYYKKNPSKWVVLALQAAGGMDPNANVIERGIQVDETDSKQEVREVPLTRKTWLEGMLQGNDLLREIPEAESMGEMDKTETVGARGALFDSRAEAGIFEFRAAQAQKIPLERWKPFALGFLKFIRAVHE